VTGLAELDAVVLAGGRGSRLGGVDKAALTVDGVTLVDRAVAAARGVRSCVVVGPVAVTAAVSVVQEEPAFSGPVAGLAAGLAALGRDASDAVLVLACDLADAQTAVAELLGAWSADPDVDGVCLADADGRQQWLAGLYRRTALDAALARLGEPTGRSVRDLVRGLALRTVAAQAAAADVDTWEDLERARREEPEMSELPPIQAWVEHLCATLGVEASVVDIRALLDATREVAHHVDRPAAPVSAFVIGVAAAREGATPEAVRAACERAAAAARAWESS
jgi:molybdopterin-guanine dinucleotide biosynthesis protein A